MAGGPNNRGVDQARVRNVVLVGPRASGKTALTEAILLESKAITRLGRVEDGTTVSDHTEVEKRLGHSVHLAVATTDVADTEVTGTAGPVRLTLLDTPGMPDFVGELRAGLRAADAALFVISATDGIDAGTRILWSECAGVGMPRAVVITHLDQPRADFGAALAELQSTFGGGLQPLYLPSGDGIAALLSRTLRTGGSDGRTVSPLDEPASAATAEARETLVEAIITESEDEGLLERYLGGEEITFDAIVADLEKAVARGAFHPVLPVNPLDGSGTAELLELVCRGLPSPAAGAMPTAYGVNGGSQPPLEPSPNASLVAEVVKTSSDAYVGRISVVRVFAGTLRPDSTVHVSGHLAQFTGRGEDAAWHADHDEDERSGAISSMLGSTLSSVGEARAGDIVAVAHLAHAETGDTISDASHPVVVETWDFPHPLLPVAIRARTSTDEDKLVKALARLQAENPSAMVNVDPGTHQLVL
ncbi:MAG: GTP-binding protein, partial [Nostocoides sp.]